MLHCMSLRRRWQNINLQTIMPNTKQCDRQLTRSDKFQQHERSTWGRWELCDDPKMIVLKSLITYKFPPYFPLAISARFAPDFSAATWTEDDPIKRHPLNRLFSLACILTKQAHSSMVRSSRRDHQRVRHCEHPGCPKEYDTVKSLTRHARKRPFDI